MFLIRIKQTKASTPSTPSPFYMYVLVQCLLFHTPIINSKSIFPPLFFSFFNSHLPTSSISASESVMFFFFVCSDFNYSNHLIIRPPPIPRKTLNVCNYARSILPRNYLIDELSALCSLYTLLISASLNLGLSPDICDSELSLPGFSIILS